MLLASSCHVCSSSTSTTENVPWRGGDRVTLTPLRQASSLWRKATHGSEQQAVQGSAHRPRLGTTVALYHYHRGQSLLQESKKEATSKALCISGWFPLGHADPAKNVTMQRIYLACLRFCLHVALALIHRRLPQTTWTC